MTTLDDLLFTLRIARDALPSDANPEHAQRLDLVERVVQRALESEPDYWRGTIERTAPVKEVTR